MHYSLSHYVHKLYVIAQKQLFWRKKLLLNGLLLKSLKVREVTKMFNFYLKAPVCLVLTAVGEVGRCDSVLVARDTFDGALKTRK
jgi:hypothetical protein